MEQTNSFPSLYQKDEAKANIVSAEIQTNEILKILLHDIKNPMSSLTGYLGLISMMAKSLDPKPKQYLMSSVWSSNEMAALCKNIEDSISIETNHFPLKLEPLQISPILQKNIEKLNPIATFFQKKIFFETIECPPCIQGDKILIERMIYTLINHSLQHCPDTKEVKISLKKQDPFLLLEIEDEGSAILKEHLEKYFDKYFSVHCGKGVRRPRGWDAYFCSLVARLHGGKIAVHQVEKRQIFSVFLPYTP